MFQTAVAGEGFSAGFCRWHARFRSGPAALATSTVIEDRDRVCDTGDGSSDEALATADWFNRATFPRAIFEARRFESLGGGRYRAIGTLVIRNIKRPFTLPLQPVTHGKCAQMTGALLIDRRAFGVGQG